jgi:hypothetical protein
MSSSIIDDVIDRLMTSSMMMSSSIDHVTQCEKTNLGVAEKFHRTTYFLKIAHIATGKPKFSY